MLVWVIVICMIVYAACVTALNLWLWREVRRGEIPRICLEHSIIRTIGVTIIYFSCSAIQLWLCIRC